MARLEAKENNPADTVERTKRFNENLQASLESLKQERDALNDALAAALQENSELAAQVKNMSSGFQDTYQSLDAANAETEAQKTRREKESHAFEKLTARFFALLLDAPEEGGETVKAEITFIVSSQEVFSCSFTVGQSQMAELQSLADQLNHGQTLYRIMVAEAQ